MRVVASAGGAVGCGRGAWVVVAPLDAGPVVLPPLTDCGFTPGGGGGGVCGRLCASAGAPANSATQTVSSITRVMRLLYEMGAIAPEEAKE